MNDQKQFKKNAQDIFLNDLRVSKKNIEIHLLNGLILKCKIINTDNFSLIVDINGKKSLVYKHSIAYIK